MLLTRSTYNSASTIRKDLTEERPLWPFSSYGPAKGEKLLIANEDVSQDELRAKFYEARLANNPALYVGLVNCAR